MALLKIRNHVDHGGFEARNILAELVVGLPTPTTAQNGRFVYNTSDNRFYVCQGATWSLKATDSDALQGLAPANLRDRGTHTGTQTSATISDLAAVVQAFRLSQFAAPNAAVGFGAQRITTLADGTAATDAVTKQQLDAVATVANNAASGVAIKAAVRVVATTAITLSGAQTIDGVAVAAGDRVLVAAQASAAANGIYVVAAGTWSRSADADATGELAPGSITSVREGSAGNADTLWGLVSDAAITIDTTPQTWGKLLASASGEIITAGAGLSKTGTTLSVVPGLGVLADASSVRIDTAVVPRKVSMDVPSGSVGPTVTHNLNTLDLVAVTVREVSSGDLVLVPWTASGVNTVVLTFGTAPTTSQYRVTVSA